MSELAFRVYEPSKPFRDVPVEDGLRIGLSASGLPVFGEGEPSSVCARVVCEGALWFLEDENPADRTVYEPGPLVTGDVRQQLNGGLRFRLGRTLVETIVVNDASKTVMLSPFAKGVPGLGRISQAPAREASASESPDDASTSRPSGADDTLETMGSSPSDAAASSKSRPAPAAPARAEEGAATEFLHIRPGSRAPSAPIVSSVTPPPVAVERASPLPGAASPQAPAPEAPAPRAERAAPSASAVGATQPLGAPPSFGPARDEARRRRRPRLVVANEAIRDLVFVESNEFVIGRKSTSEQPVAHVLAHDGVSSAHARITYDGQEFWIEDLGSKNHTYVGGKRLEANVRTLLPNETAVRFAVIDALFVFDPEPEAETLARRVYETTLARLREKSVITQAQEARARQEAGGDVRRVGEKLLLGGVLSVAQWGDAYRKAENSVARESVGGGKRAERGAGAGVPKLSLVHVLIGLIVLVLLAIITLLTVQWAK